MHSSAAARMPSLRRESEPSCITTYGERVNCKSSGHFGDCAVRLQNHCGQAVVPDGAGPEDAGATHGFFGFQKYAIRRFESIRSVSFSQRLPSQSTGLIRIENVAERITAWYLDRGAKSLFHLNAVLLFTTGSNHRLAG